MSTKTLRKRIALVAVSAMGFGLLTSVGANATGPTASHIYLGQTASTTGSAVTSASTIESLTSVGYVSLSDTDGDFTTGTITGTILPNAQISLMAGAGGSGNITSAVVTGGYISSGSSATINSDLSNAVSGTNAAMGIVVKPSGAAGSVMTVAFFYGTGVANATPSNGTLLATVALTVAAASSSNVPSAAKSTFTVDTTARSGTVDVAQGFTVANGGTGYVYATVADAYGAVLTGTHVYSVAATNGAYVGFSAYPTSTSAVSTSVQNQVYVRQAVANTAVTTDVTLTVDGVVVGTKSIKFLGDLAKIVPSENFIASTTAGASNAEAVTFKAYDAAGNRVSATVALKGGNSVVPSATVTQTVGSAGTETLTTGKLNPTCATQGKNSGLFLAATNAAGATIVSPTFTISCAADLYTYKAALDKTTYKQGEIATLTISTFDAYGNPANDVQSIGDATYKPATSGSYMTAVSAPVYTDLTSMGKITYQFVVGNTAGSYSLAVDLPLLTKYALSDTSKTLPYTIQGDGSVSNAEVLASIVKLIASINKQIAALQKALKLKK